MGALLTLILKHHDEPVELIEPMLQSINTQIGVDFNEIEIIISNNTDMWFDYYSVLNHLPNIKNRVIFLKHPQYSYSIGMNVEMGVRYCKTPYYTILDCDDVLATNMSLNAMLQNIKKSPEYDMLVFRYYIYNNPSKIPPAALPDPIDCAGGTWGVVIKKEFMTKNNIHYSEKLTRYEDIFINQCVHLIKEKKVKACNEFVYIWIQKDVDGKKQRTYSQQYDSDSNEYYNTTKMQLTMTQELIRFASTNENAKYDIYQLLINELAYYYWRLQYLANKIGPENIDNTIIEKANRLIVDVYSSLMPDDFFSVFTDYFNGNIMNVSTTGDTTTCKQWVEKVFGINFDTKDFVIKKRDVQ